MTFSPSKALEHLGPSLTARLVPPRAGSACGPLLIVRFPQPHAVLSWAVINGGRSRTDAVVWRQVMDLELTRGVDPVALLATSLEEASLESAVGLLTSRSVSTFEDAVCTDGDLFARCIATVGLSNALAAGDTPGPLRPVGTINLLCQVSHPLTEGAMVEAIALAAEARTAAVLDARVLSGRSSRFSTGTGTDCIVVAAPEGPDAHRYIGKHTPLGSLLGAAAREAVSLGARAWLEEREGTA